MESLEVRVLGPLEVIRTDGSLVDPGAWRTGKTMDLLRILALENDQPVRTSSLVGLLWPDVDSEHGRGSLRTAASTIRAAVGQDVVARRHGDLVLVSTNVDVDDYRDLVAAVSRATARGDDQEALLLIEAAETLYRGDFRASDDGQRWATFARDELRRLRQTSLLDATTCALRLGDFRGAIDLAHATVRLDPASESAHRALMRAHAELGEVGQALMVFEDYRERLSDELGIDPSRETKDLHLRILQDQELAPLDHHV